MTQAIATVPKTRARGARRRKPPGPNPLTEVPRSPAADRRFFEKAVTAREDWGEVVRVGFPPFERYIVYHPDDVQHVLLDNHANYHKDCLEYRSLRMALGQGLVTSDGALWRRQRKLAAPAFTPARVAAFGGVMTRAGTALCDSWGPRARDGEPFELTADMMGTALRIVRDAKNLDQQASLADRGMLIHVDDRSGGTRPMAGSPYRFSNARAGVRGPSAHLGEHNRDVLEDWLGLPDEEIDQLTASDLLLSRQPDSETSA